MLVCFYFPFAQSEDENDPVKQLVTCLSKKNVKRCPQKLIRASVVSSLTQFLTLLKVWCAFWIGNKLSGVETVFQFTNKLLRLLKNYVSALITIWLLSKPAKAGRFLAGHYAKCFSTKAPSILAVCTCMRKCVSNFHELRKEKGLFICIRQCVFSQQGVLLDFTGLGRHPQVLPSPLPLFRSLSVNTYWIRWAAVGRGVLIDIYEAEFCSGLQRTEKEHQERREVCFCTCVFKEWGISESVAIQTHHRFSPRDLRWNLRCLWRTFSLKLTSKPVKSSPYYNYILYYNSATNYSTKNRKFIVIKYYRMGNFKSFFNYLCHLLFFFSLFTVTAVKCKTAPPVTHSLCSVEKNM